MKLKKSAIFIGVALLGSGTYVNAETRLVSLVNCDTQVKFNVGIGNRKCNGVLDPNTPSNPPVLPPFEKPTFTQIVNSKYKMALDDEGNVWEANDKEEWYITSMTDVKKISVSFTHAIALKKNGDVYGKGDNSRGQLGLGDSTDRKNWTKIPVSNISDVLATGGMDGCYDVANTFIIKSGEVFSTGSNGYSQLGRDSYAECGDEDCYDFGTTSLTNIKSLEGGVDYIFALSNTGDLYSTWNYTNTWSHVMSAVTDYSVSAHDIFVVNGGNVYGHGQTISDYISNPNPVMKDDFYQTNLTSPSDIMMFGGESEYSYSSGYALKNGTLYVIGNNESGRMGVPGNSDIIGWTDSGLSDVVRLFDDGGGNTVYIEKSDGNYYYANNGTFNEIKYLIDSDGDGISDDQEIEDGTDPNNDEDYLISVLHPNSGIIDVFVEDDVIFYTDNGGSNGLNVATNDYTGVKFIMDEKWSVLEGEIKSFSLSNNDFVEFYDGQDEYGYPTSYMGRCNGTTCTQNLFRTKSNTLSFMSETYESGFDGWLIEVKKKPYPNFSGWGEYLEYISCLSKPLQNGFVDTTDKIYCSSNVLTTGPENIVVGDLGISTIYEIDLSNQKELTNVNFLSSIETTSRDIYIDQNINLTNVSGLSNLNRVGDDLRIAENDNLTTISGLSNLVHVNDSFNINSNPLLTTLDGLDNLEHVDTLNLVGSPIKDFSALSNLKNSGTIYIDDISSPIFPESGNWCDNGIFENISDTNMKKKASIDCGYIYQEFSNQVVTLDKDKYFLDNGGVNNYSPNMNSLVTFVPNPGEGVALVFSDFLLASDDSLEIYEGVDDTGRLLKTCLNSDCLNGSAFSGTDESLTVKFISNSSLESDGWSAIVKSEDTILDTDNDGLPNATDPDDDNDGFNDDLEIKSGTDPLDPLDYPKIILHPLIDSTMAINEEMTYYDDGGIDGDSKAEIISTLTMVPPSGFAIKVDFVEFNTPTDDTDLTIFAGDKAKIDFKLSKCEGTKCQNKSFTSYHLNGQMTFKYKSKWSTLSGWIANVSLVDQSTLDLTDTDGDKLANPSDKDDDGDGYYDTVEIAEGSDPLDPNSVPNTVLQPSKGSLTVAVDAGMKYYDSGSSISDYVAHENGVVYMTPPSGKYLSVTFNSYTLGNWSNMLVYNGETQDDYLTIYDPNIKPTTVTSSSPNGGLTFKFIADWSTGIGWDAIINTHDIVDSDNDTFADHVEVFAGTNPSDSNSYPSNLDSDNDGKPDFRDGDNDNDGYPNVVEVDFGTDPLNASDFPSCNMNPGSGDGDGNGGGNGGCF